MTYLKVTGGVLKVKSNLVSGGGCPCGVEEKADQLRVYSGSKYRLVSEAPAGDRLCGAGPHKDLSRTGPWLYSRMPASRCWNRC